MSPRKDKAPDPPVEPHPDAAEPIVVFSAVGGPVEVSPVFVGETGPELVVPVENEDEQTEDPAQKETGK